ncbi:MAG TPA: hypothetical protein VD908_13435 [Cytophagales bacterium]|nr:hypothetical protein [Cytophagales bacterium]
MNEIVLDQEDHHSKPLIIKGKNHFTAPGIYAGYALVVAGGIGLIDSLFFSFSLVQFLITLFVCFLGLIFITTKEGFLLNSERKSYKDATFFLGKAYGTWVHLPEIEAVIVSPASFHYKVQNAITPEMTFREDLYKVMLYVKNADRGIIISLFKRSKALEVADTLSRRLRVPVEEIVND